MQAKSPSQSSLQADVDRYIFRWHDFPFDYWWRKKYNVPFGSAAHREMSFLDIYIEWRENLLMTRAIEEEINEDWTEEDYRKAGAPLDTDKDPNAVKMTQQEIEEDYDNLDLEQFDKK